jgi:hypothetical protein
VPKELSIGAALAVMPYIPDIPAKIALTTIGVALSSVIYVIANAVVSEIVPVAQRGALLAIGTAVSTSAGILAPYVMDSVVDAVATPLRRCDRQTRCWRRQLGLPERPDSGETVASLRWLTATGLASVRFRYLS